MARWRTLHEISVVATLIAENDKYVVIAFSEEDFAELNVSTRKFLETGLPKLVEDLAHRSARSILKTLKRNWPDQYEWEQATHLGFRHRLEARWGKALDLLRILLTVSREIGSETYKKLRRSRAKRDRHRSDVLLRLHARACRVAGEIIVLMESGYADGAMAHAS